MACFFLTSFFYRSFASNIIPRYLLINMIRRASLRSYPYAYIQLFRCIYLLPGSTDQVGSSPLSPSPHIRSPCHPATVFLAFFPSPSTSFPFSIVFGVLYALTHHTCLNNLSRPMNHSQFLSSSPYSLHLALL